MNIIADIERENRRVFDYLSYYLYNSGDTDYAVLLNGPWGSGKTYFVKNNFLNTDDELNRPLYISLNGVSSISEITDQFFTQLHPKLSSKSLKMLGIIASRIINGYTGTDVAKDESDKSIIQDVFLNINKRVIIFDDLERCLIPIQSVLGYINSFVEHEDCKVLIIASESDLAKDQLNEYSLKKEKTIGKTISLTPPIENVIDFFSNNCVNQLTKKTIVDNKKIVLNIVKESGSVNFRSLRAILNDFERLVSTFETQLIESNAALTKLMASMLAIGIEYKAGAISPEKIESISTNSFNYALSKNLNNKIDPIIEKYSSVDWFDPVIPYNSLAVIFSTGIIDSQKISKHLSEHPLLCSEQFTQYWRELWGWTKLTRTRFLFCLNGLKGQLSRYEIVEPEIILHILGIVLSLELRNEKSITQGLDVLTFFKNYIDVTKSSGELLPDIEFFNDHHPSKYNLGFLCNDMVEFKEIKKHLKDATNYRFYWLLKKTYPELLFTMSQNISEYSILYEFDINAGGYGGISFLNIIPPGYFSIMIVNDWKCNGPLLSSLLQRYSRDVNNKNLVDEYSWLKKVKEITLGIVNNAEEPHKSQLVDDLDYYFNAIETKIL